MEPVLSGADLSSVARRSFFAKAAGWPLPRWGHRGPKTQMNSRDQGWGSYFENT
jgi:hypothetical protein